MRFWIVSLVLLCTCAFAVGIHHRARLHEDLLDILENADNAEPIPSNFLPTFSHPKDTFSYSHMDASLQANADQWEDMRVFIRSFMQCQLLPGLTVGIVKDGKPIFAEGFGFRDVEKQLPVENTTLFGIGSTSKAFTSFLIGMLHEEAKLDLDARVSDYLPGWRLMDDESNARVTIRDLLAHRTGLPRHDGSLWNYQHHERREAVFNARYLSPTYQLREKWQYNNWMIMVAGYLSGVVAGAASWEDLIAERVFSPLGMNNTYANFQKAQNNSQNAIPANYNSKTGNWTNMDWSANLMIDCAAPAGAVVSNAMDMNKWLLAHLNTPVFPSGQAPTHWVSPSMLVDLHGRHMSMPSSSSAYPTEYLKTMRLLMGDNYGLNWFSTQYRGMEFVFHGGDVIGFHTQVSLYPENGLGIFISTNANNAGSHWRAILTAFITDYVMGFAPLFYGNVTQACRFPCDFWPTYPGCTASAPAPTSSPSFSRPSKTFAKTMPLSSSSSSSFASPSPSPSHTSTHSPTRAVPLSPSLLSSLSPSSPSSNALTEYEGDYFHPAYRNFTVGLYQDNIYCLFGINVLGPFLNAGGDSFLWADGQMYLVFARRANTGKVMKVTLYYAEDAVYAIPFTNDQYVSGSDPNACAMTANTHSSIMPVHTVAVENKAVFTYTYNLTKEMETKIQMFNETLTHFYELNNTINNDYRSELKNNNNGISAGAMIGAMFGCFVLTTLTTVFVLFCLLKRSSSSYSSETMLSPFITNPNNNKLTTTGGPSPI
eukprot:TRINITY_DN4986_c0_g1_i1.p1 TRINITY_DN4986_c0_g1~~TRINITY_DN4986_c0_g1_i1.p1  ORF type:complete len:766 (-),score=225.44 TRINITY_DN4986_c0_g1_i1:327-2624(-)